MIIQCVIFILLVILMFIVVSSSSERLQSHRLDPLLDNLMNETYARIGSSPIHGVGVIAIRDIPTGVNPYPTIGKDFMPTVISDKDFCRLPEATQKMLMDFVPKRIGGRWYVPSGGMNSINIRFYQNHSNAPNVKVSPDIGRSPSFIHFETIKPIQKGEELVVDYNDL